MKNTQEKIDKLEIRLEKEEAAFKTKEENLKLQEIVLAGLLQKLFEIELPYFKEYNCTTLLDYNKIIIRIPIQKETGTGFYTTDVNLSFSGGEILDVSSGAFMANLNQLPQKHRGDGISHQLAIAVNNKKEFIKVATTHFLAYKKFNDEIRDLKTRIINVHQNINNVAKFKKSTIVLKEIYNDSIVHTFEAPSKEFSNECIEKYLDGLSLPILRNTIAPLFNTGGTKNEIISNIMERLYV